MQVSLQADTERAATKQQVVHPDPLPERRPDALHPEPARPENEQAAAAPARNQDAPAVADVEPDYKADYLHNPVPPYPMMARRMGLQGRVILDVEVLENGRCGEISVAQSSGHDVLDRAALRTVKSWDFTPARQGGRAVTGRFKVPIVFSLRDAKHE